MKKNSLLIITLLLSSISIAQKLDYKTNLDNALQNYEKENSAIQDKLFKENIAKAFNQVIFSSSDLVSNASAFGYTQNEEKTNVSISTNLRLGDESSTWYLRTGANATGSKNVFEFYSDDSWNNNVSLNIGIIKKIGNSGVFFNGDAKKFNEVHTKRRINASEPLYKAQLYTSNRLTDIKNLKQDILNLNNLNTISSNYAALLNELPEIKKLIEGKKYEDTYDQLSLEEKNIQDYLDALNDQKKMDALIKNDILYKFDKNNDITYGYSLMWLDLNLNLGNSTYKFSESNIDATIIEDFGNTFNISEDINKLKSTLSVNFNYTRNSENRIWFAQGGISATSGSFLENVLINGTPQIIQNQDQEYVFQDEDDQILGSFDNIKETFTTGSFNAYGAIFITKKKNFGFNIALSHNYLINKPDGTFFKNNFTTLFGPIFRQEKDGETKLTFGIDLGWENALYNTRISDNFTGRIRVGIPFNIYSKKKK
ncbi:hypothetical protein [Psychroserpens sp.]|uniref:hypothetical protein n=1 Tax=Psychroserpens sp. TaxID=2020870 RepID=UPI001B2E6B31|nr:hypothetical protein [Psychroserpens sp.]MBO6606327.1 hypothetical protein [Psychroserpens sp.]MBO6631970.1 hypothetical protein [Psychroserpens sp.]MBO6653031.1 hypothetical protein [Psychroserpens sp.]MBO6680942.1 hypothetical protein [Psychroserpens sp.]MBO6750102.1 hypothetical protein [Psychroserpens sp.]